MQNHPYREAQIVKREKPRRGEYRIRLRDDGTYVIDRYRWLFWISWFGYWDVERLCLSEKEALRKVDKLIGIRDQVNRKNILWEESN